MAEIKRIPSQGLMNLDVTDRLLQPGQTREALNVGIGESESSDVGQVENILGNEIPYSGSLGFSTDADAPRPRCIGVYRDNGGERLFFFVTSNRSIDGSNSAEHGVFEFNQTTSQLIRLATGSWLNFHTDFNITGINFVDDLLFWTDNRNEPRKINVDRARNNNDFYTGDDLAAVAKFAPYTPPGLSSISTEGTSTFLENKLPRFAYRWQFNDGEYSVISPFSPICFLNNSSHSLDVNSGEISTFVNEVQQVILNAPTPSGFGITTVEFLYKETVSQNIYIIDTVNVTGDTTSFTYNSQDPFRPLPATQLTRTHDAVPRLAKSQELVGGRLVYGDFLQNRDLPTISFSVGVNTTHDSESTFPNYSVKSRRTYQVGVVLADRYGRQTPVILSATGGDTIFLPAKSGNLPDVFQQLTITFETELPEWVYSYRVVVKQREQEYYNVFTSSSTAGQVTRSGDTINKLPIDRTAVLTGAETYSPSDESVYSKIAGGTNNTNNQLIKVQGISLNGSVALIPGASGSGLVYETEPRESLLDIFFETSTGGLETDVTLNSPINIDYYNCFILNVGSLHIEINRLRAGFNEPTFDLGVRAFAVIEDYAGEERRFNSLIHSSGVFNSRTGLNQINQFNESEGGLIVSLDPSDGSVQKLYGEDTQLIIFQEDKVSRSPIDKDFIYSAEGGAVPVTSNTQFLGTIAPYAGEYGISNNPESFAIYGTRKYFTDSNRGVVLRLSQDGLSEVSKNGLSDFFRDAFRTADRVIGSFDEYHDQYNVTIEGEGYSSTEDTNIATATDGYFTISFSENVNGWVSFKSFDQETGVTLNNRYYTFNGGDLWEHNSRNVSRNDFYGQGSADSYVDVIFNDAPSVVKEFKTIGYEGTSGWVCESLVTDLTTIGDVPVLEDTFTVTLQTTGTLTNATVSGARSFIRPNNTEVSWTLVFEPTSAIYEFGDVDDIVVALAAGETSVVTLEPKTLVDGRIIQPVDHTIIANDTIELTTNGEAPLSPTGVLLTIELINNILNTNLSQSIISLLVNAFTNNESTISFTITVEDSDYYFADPVGITLTESEGTYLDESGAVITRVDDSEATVSIVATAPNSLDSTILTIDGAVERFDYSTFNLITTRLIPGSDPPAFSNILTIGTATIDPDMLTLKNGVDGTATITIVPTDPENPFTNTSGLGAIASVDGISIGTPAVVDGNIEIVVTRTGAQETNTFDITLEDA